MTDEKPEFMLRDKNAEKKQKSFVLRAAVVLYCFMVAFCFAWAFVREDLDLFHHPSPALELPWHADLWGGLIAGVLFGYIVAWLSRVVATRADWAWKLMREMKGILGALNPSDALFLAAISALSEEILFRGVLQSHLGIVASSLIFGLAHLPRNRIFIIWTVEATVLGFCLGLLFVCTGNLVAPVAAHFTINFKNLLFIQKAGDTIRSS